MNPALAFLLGALSVGIAQTIWSIGHAYFDWPSAWILKPNAGVVLSMSLVALAAAGACFYRRANIFVQLLCVGLGAFAAVAVGLFVVGPGNLWPIVLIIDGTIVSGAVALGSLIGYVFRKLRAHAA